jgi:hypothetical protein
MRPVGLGTKNHCAGEEQQQFSSQLVSQRGQKLLSMEAVKKIRTAESHYQATVT